MRWSPLPSPDRLARGALAQATPRSGGVLTVHVGSEQRVLNPAIRASTGVYIFTSKIIEALVDLDAAIDRKVRRFMGPAAAYAIAYWPTPIVFSGWEIGQEIMTGAGLRQVRRG